LVGSLAKTSLEGDALLEVRLRGGWLVGSLAKRSWRGCTFGSAPTGRVVGGLVGENELKGDALLEVRLRGWWLVGSFQKRVWRGTHFWKCVLRFGCDVFLTWAGVWG
jgi:hypothetical protein